MKLTNNKIRWIIQQKVDGKLHNQDIAATQHVSEARVKQLWSEYRRTGTAHQLKSPGRPAKGPLSLPEEQVIVDAFMKHKCGAVYLERMLKNEGFNFSHNVIHSVLMKNRMSSAEPNKRIKRKYMKYEGGTACQCGILTGMK